MAKKEARRLSEVVQLKAHEGANDARWFLMEHQLYQLIVSMQTIRQLCEQIGDAPENDNEWELARSVLEIISPLYVKALGARASVMALLAGTDVAERLGRIEHE